jgi:phospholipid transport system substrate-binding protein
MPRFFTTTVIFLLTSLWCAVPGVANTGPEEFVRTLGNEALGVIRADMTPARKQAFFRQLLQQDFDVPGIARFVLGPYWRVASEAQKQEFCKLFEDYIVRVYSQKFAQYRGETLKVTGSRSDPESALVTSEIVRPQGPPIRADWRLATRDGLYKISDIIIDGVSMDVTERSEFASIIQRSGGQMQVLLAMMRGEATAPAGAPPAGLPSGVGSSLPPR